MRTIKRLSMLIMLALVNIICVGCSKKEDITDLSFRSASGENGVVSSASPYASQAGLEVLEQGGNAFEAAVAVAFALGVVEPFASGIGGGGLMVAYNATTGKYVSYNFREFVPGSGTAENYREQYVDNFDIYWEEYNRGEVSTYDREEVYREYLDKQSDTTEIFADGALSVGVPTEVSGLLTILINEASGNLGSEEEQRKIVLAPAIRYAKEGFNVTSNLADTLAECINNINYVEGAEVFFKDGVVSNGTLEEGDLLVQENYGNVLEKIANEGKKGFYQGEVGDAIIAAMEEYGGIITQEDLDYAMNNYPVEITPVVGEYKGYTIASSNVPSSGGTILVETLNMLEYYQETYDVDLASLGHNSAEYINILATCLQLAYSDKRKYIADTSNDLNIKNYIPTLTSKEYAKWRFESVYNPKTEISQLLGNYTVKNGYAYNNLNTGEEYYGDMEAYAAYLASLGEDVDLLDYQVTDGVEPEEHYSTTSFSVADKWGNIVSVTQTINHFFGSHIIPTSHNEDGDVTYACGFFLNNQLGTCSFNGSSVNYVKPYKQPVSHIMPTIITKDGLPYATLGSPGSMRIPSTVTQVILNLIDFDMDIQEAIAAPRIFIYSTGGGDDKTTKWSHDAKDYGKTGKMLWIECASRALINELTNMGYYIPLDNRYADIDLYFGGVHGITFDTKTGIMTGGADPRRDGKALSF